MPSLVLGGSPLPILHVSQLASALGLPAPAGAGASAAARDLVSILDAWCSHLAALDWDDVTAPTPSRGRSLRNLTVNTFDPIGLLPEAWATGAFAWDPDEDEKRERALGDMQALRSYAARIARAWADFVVETEGELARDPVVSSPRGDVPFSDLLASQRWHAAYHYRQLVEFLRARGTQLEDALDVEELLDIDLPEHVF